MDEYLIPTQFGEAEFVEKKSRFIGRVWPVDTEEEALAKIQEMKKKHYDATHNCWAYIIRDGAVRFSDDDIPIEITDVLGHSHRDRINTLVCDAIRTSREFGKVCLSPDVDRALKELRSFMFTNVYRNPVAKGEESKAKDMLKRLFEYYIAHPEALPEDFQPQLSFDGMERTVCDYIAGMTDNYAVEKFREIFIPMGWQVHG